MAVKQVSIFIENETGRLTALTGILAEAGIDLNAATIAETGEYGILRCIVQDPDHTCQVLSKKGFMASVSDVIAVAIDNKPGGLHYVLEMLSGDWEHAQDKPARPRLWAAKSASMTKRQKAPASSS